MMMPQSLPLSVQEDPLPKQETILLPAVGVLPHIVKSMTTEFTMGGARYRDDYQLMFCFPNIVDTLLAVKTLVFDSKKYTLSEFLNAVRHNREGYEDMQTLIKKRGDFFVNDNERSNGMAERFFETLYGFLNGKKN